MTGLWKTRISGFTKDSRRKKMAKKHYLKDKVKAIYTRMKNKNKVPKKVFICNENSSQPLKNIVLIYNTIAPSKISALFGFWSTNERKDFQKIVHKRERAAVREWISHNNFEKPIKTNDLSKSIEKAIY